MAVWAEFLFRVLIPDLKSRVPLPPVSPKIINNNNIYMPSPKFYIKILPKRAFFIPLEPEKMRNIG